MKRQRQLIFIATLFLINCRNQITEEIYLIPKNFIGNVIVIYNQPNGIADSISNHKVIYKIPKTGVLYLKGKQHLQDLSQMKYYYYDDKEIKKICQYNYDTLSSCNAVVYNNRAESFRLSLDKNQYSYSVITIGTNDRIPPEFDPKELFK